jgi:hypothetical protein
VFLQLRAIGKRRECSPGELYWTPLCRMLRIFRTRDQRVSSCTSCCVPDSPQDGRGDGGNVNVGARPGHAPCGCWGRLAKGETRGAEEVGSRLGHSRVSWLGGVQPQFQVTTVTPAPRRPSSLHCVFYEAPALTPVTLGGEPWPITSVRRNGIPLESVCSPYRMRPYSRVGQRTG